MKIRTSNFELPLYHEKNGNDEDRGDNDDNFTDNTD